MPDNNLYFQETIINKIRTTKRNIKEVHLHHTYRPNKAMFDELLRNSKYLPDGKNHIKLQDGMRSYHMNTLKWKDIGQHLTLFPDGRFMIGRDFEIDPASISGRNEGALAIEMIGDFDVETLEGAQLKSILKIIEAICINDGKQLVFHNEYAPKTCPGKSVNKAALLAQARALSAPPPVVPTVKDAWKIEPIKQLLEKQIIESDAWVFEPDIPIKAWQLAVVINRAVEYVLKQV